MLLQLMRFVRIHSFHVQSYCDLKLVQIASSFNFNHKLFWSWLHVFWKCRNHAVKPNSNLQKLQKVPPHTRYTPPISSNRHRSICHSFHYALLRIQQHSLLYIFQSSHCSVLLRSSFSTNCITLKRQGLLGDTISTKYDMSLSKIQSNPRLHPHSTPYTSIINRVKPPLLRDNREEHAMLFR